MRCCGGLPILTVSRSQAQWWVPEVPVRLQAFGPELASRDGGVSPRAEVPEV